MPNDKNGEALVLDLLNGYLRSKVLMTGYHLDLFSLACDRALPREELLEARDLPSRTGNILLDALQALGLLEEDEEGIRTPSSLIPILDRRSKDFQTTAFMIEHLNSHYPHLDDLGGIIESNGESSKFNHWDYFDHEGAVADVDRRKAERYSRYMAETMKHIGNTVLRLYDMTGHRHLVDLFGGPGTLAQLALRAVPELRATLIEVPAVADLARQWVAALPDIEARFTAIGADIFAMDLPRDADIFTMIRAAQHWDDEVLLELYGRIADALPSGGKLLVVERMVPEDFDPESESIYLRSVYLATISSHSQFRKQSEHAALLTKGGFETVQFRTAREAPYAFLKKGWSFAVATKG